MFAKKDIRTVSATVLLFLMRFFLSMETHNLKSVILNEPQSFLIPLVLTVIFALLFAFCCVQLLLKENNSAAVLAFILLAFDTVCTGFFTNLLFLMLAILTFAVLCILLRHRSPLAGLTGIAVCSLSFSLLCVPALWQVLPLLCALYLIRAGGSKSDWLRSAAAGLLPMAAGLVLPRTVHSGIVNFLGRFMKIQDILPPGSTAFTFSRLHLKPAIFYLVFIILFLVLWMDNVKANRKDRAETPKKRNRSGNPKRNVFAEERAYRLPLVLYLAVFTLNFAALFLYNHAVANNLLSVMPLLTAAMMYCAGESNTVSLANKAGDFIGRHTVLAVLFVLLYAGFSVADGNAFYDHITTIYT